MLSYYVSLHSEFHVLMSYYLSIKTMLGSSLPPVVCGRAHFLFVFVYIYIVVFNTYCVVFLLCLSLSCQFLLIASSVFSNIYLHSIAEDGVEKMFKTF